MTIEIPLRGIGANARRAPAASAAIAACAGCVALAARPAVVWAGLAVTAIVGLTGALAPAPADRKTSPPATVGAALLGIVAFGSMRVIAAVPPAGFTLATAFVVVVAAVAQELFFRRFLYGELVRWGTAAAVIGTAIAFALVHIPAYGAAAFPIDLAAGLILGWQRWATGSWGAPAVSHAAANLMAIL